MADPTAMPRPGRVAFVLKGYPRLSETFIAQEIAALEQLGLQILIVSLRHPTDQRTHPVHAEIRAPLLYLLDSDRKALTVARRDTNGVWQAVRSTALPVTDFSRLVPLSLGGRETNTVGFIGNNTVAWKRFAGDVWDLTELDGYETPIRDGWLHDVTSGDLDSDGRRDLVFLETARNYVDLVRFEAPHRLGSGNRWPVFEERTFRQRRNEVPEPREAVVADVTGDGKNDLLLIVHDRVLLYPQE